MEKRSKFEKILEKDEKLKGLQRKLDGRTREFNKEVLELSEKIFGSSYEDVSNRKKLKHQIKITFY